MAWCRSLIGSLSLLSRERQTTEHLQPAAHSLINVALAKPAGADDEADASHQGELAIQTRVQLLNQARARHKRRPDGRGIELGFQKGGVDTGVKVQRTALGAPSAGTNC